MHKIEPFFNWRDRYTAEADRNSPFYNRTYNEFTYDKISYNFYIHPQWDEIGSEGLFVKLLFVDYLKGYSIIELFGEWNDSIDNDIMLLRQELIDPLVDQGINKIILIGENLLNFHGQDTDYYEELSEELLDMDGWIVGLNFRPHIIQEMETTGVTYSIQLREPFTNIKWRPYEPTKLFDAVEELFYNWLDDGLKLLG